MEKNEYSYLFSQGRFKQLGVRIGIEYKYLDVITYSLPINFFVLLLVSLPVEHPVKIFTKKKESIRKKQTITNK